MTTVIRASYLSEYPDCARRVAAKIFAKDIEAAGFRLRETVRNVGAAVGTAVHKGASVILQEKVVLGRMPPADVGLDAARDKLREVANEGIAYDDMSKRLPEAENAALRMVVAYRDELAPWIDPIAIEQRLEAKAGPGLMLSGQSDLVAREPDQIVDLKTGKAMAPGNHRPQLGAYSLLARAHKIDIRQGRIDYIRRVGPKADQPPPVTEVHDIDEVESAAANILRAMAADIKTFREGDSRRTITPGDPWIFLANP
ncbi:MAG TPA: PD-(D/E)XK nuclease family protein, partial [Dongiaceae bacterium]|nr:PD-(D/E)XK nuclease family protein [Dongiaceae bacterium]